MKWPGFLSYWPRDHGPETPREETIRETAVDEADMKVQVALEKADEAMEIALEKANRKIAYLFFVIVVFGVLLGVPTTQSTENSYQNCVRFNMALDYLASGANPVSKTLTPQKATARVQALHGFKGHCTGVWPFQP